MRRLRPAAGLALTGLALASCSSGGSATAPSTSAVPVGSTSPSTASSARPAPTTTEPTPSTTLIVSRTIAWIDLVSAPGRRIDYAHTLQTPITHAPSCSLNDLRVEADANGGFGSWVGRLWVHNIGPSACDVQGLPLVELIDDSGAIVRRTDLARAGADRSAAAVLVPDSWAIADLGYIASICDTYPSSKLRFHWGGDQVTIPYEVGGGVPDACPPVTAKAKPPFLFDQMTAFAPNDQYIGKNPVPWGLTVRIDAPESVAAGSRLHYSVLLTNTSSYEVRLDSTLCPVYAETLGGSFGEYLLNCTVNDEWIGIRETMRFEMELAVLASTPPGPATLSWQTTEPVGVFAAATVNVTG